MEKNNINIKTYLSLGYTLPQDVQLPWNPVFNRAHPIEKNLIHQGCDALQNVFQKSTRDANKGSHIIPLSGGLDSRAILGGLLEYYDRKNVLAVTFGIPGTFDFDIAKHIAKKSAISIYPINLSKMTWSTTDLVQFARNTKHTTSIFDSYINYQIPKTFGSNETYWSGFMGEAISGAHLPKTLSKTWKEAKNYFLSWNRVGKQLEPNKFDPSIMLPKDPLMSHNQLSYDDQLDFSIRQQNLIRHVTIHGNYITPFLHQEWLSFMLSCQPEYRKDQKIYKEILLQLYPRLFSLPTKTYYGLPLSASSKDVRKAYWKTAKTYALYRLRCPFGYTSYPPFINYIDFNQDMRHKSSFQNLIRENLQDLQQRNIIDWIDINKLWKAHQRGFWDYSTILLILASLEINIKAGKFSNETLI